MTALSPQQLQEMWDDLKAMWEAHSAGLPTRAEWRRAAVYMRESRQQQAEGFSPAAQLKGTLEEATRRQLSVPWENVFLDLLSGRREDRVAFQDMLALARSGTIAAVIVLHTSRFSRNAVVSRKYKEELRRRGVEVIATNAPFDVGRPEGKFAERMIEAVDEFTSDTIGWWVSVGLREKHQQGEPLGRLPETFFRDASGIVPHPELSAIVLEGARQYSTGRVGFGDLSKWSEREGHRTPLGRRLTDEWWRNVLANPLNAGFVGYRRKRGGKELRKAAFSGFITLDLFERVQEVRHGRTRSPRQGADYRVYPLTAVAFCAACGARFTASGKQRMRCRSASQHAGCSQPSVAASEIERRFAVWLRSAVVLSPAERIRVAAIVRARLERTRGTASETKVRLAIKRLTDAFVYGGIGDADYREELQKHQAQLASAQTAPDERRTLSAIKVAQDFATAWDRSRPERKKQLLSTMFEAVKIRDGSPVAVRPKPELAPLFAARVHTGGPDRIRTGDLVLDRDVCLSLIHI